MPRKKRPLDRDSGVVRDASLIVIASEDTYAVRDYFSRFRTRRVQFVIIPTAHGQSAPANVIVRLDNFKDDTATEEDDQFWLCIDKDHWANSGHIANLTQVLQHCAQKRYQVAISNPCFELWLLLHFEDVGPTDQRTCRQIARRLSELAGGYTKKHCGLLPLNETMVKDAVKRAQSLDTSTSLIPDAQSTGVYRIIAALQAKDLSTSHSRNQCSVPYVSATLPAAHGGRVGGSPTERRGRGLSRGDRPKAMVAVSLPDASPESHALGPQSVYGDARRLIRPQGASRTAD